MIDPTSRYHAIGDATHVEPDGRVIVHKRRRLLPPPPDRPGAEALVTDGDRLDLLAARTIGDPTAFWRLCDANVALHPAELERPGRRVRLPGPGL